MLVLHGENSYEKDQAIKKLTKNFDGEVAIKYGDEISISDLPDLFMGQSLFSTQRLVIIKNLSDNKSLWDRLEEWVQRLGDGNHLVLSESKIDKRSLVWKYLQKYAKVQELPLLTSKDKTYVTSWLKECANSKGLLLETKYANYLINRIGFNQWYLASAVDKLALAAIVDEPTIDKVSDISNKEVAFNLLEMSLMGKTKQLRIVLDSVKKTEDPYRVMGLISSQIIQLSAVDAQKNMSTTEIAQELNMKPFIVGKLSKLTSYYRREYISLIAKVDLCIKTKNTRPWEMIEYLLIQIALK